MALLPASMQDKTEYLPLGPALKKPEPVKADPIREFEKQNHDIPGAPRAHHVTPEVVASALRSLMRDLRPLDELSELSKPLTWPTLPDLPARQAEIQSCDRRRGIGLVRAIDGHLSAHRTMAITALDMASVREYFGDLGMPEGWRGRVYESPYAGALGS